MRQVNFQPLFKPDFTGVNFTKFTNTLIGPAAPIATPKHGPVLHGRIERSQTTDDLLVACIKLHVEAAGGSWEGRATPLYQAVLQHALVLAPALPLDFPRSPTAFGWAFRRIGHDGFEAAGLEWRRWRSNGRDRAPMNSFRLSPFGLEGKSGRVA